MTIRHVDRRQPRIALEVSSVLTPQPSGVGVYALGLIDALRRQLGRDRLALVCRRSRHREPAHATLADLPLHSYVTGARLVRRFPLLHALDTRFPPLYRGRIVATVYDVLAALPLRSRRPLAPARFRRRKLAQYRRIGRRADAVISLSEETRDRFLERFPCRGRFEVVPPGVDSRFFEARADPSRLRALGLSPGGYVLSVGELCARKNLEVVVEAFRRLRAGRPDLELALVGRPSYGWADSEAEASIRRDPSGIQLLGFVDAQLLPQLYAGAAALVHASLYEGFGLPVVEALAAGAPVIAAARGGIAEAAGGAAELVDPEDVSAVAASLEGVLAEDDKARQSRRARGRDRARQLTWERAAERVLCIYRDVLGASVFW